jgi:hypothetical protein
MCKINKLELEFEIVTLDHNMDKLKKLGFRTEELQNRLEFCRAQFEKLKRDASNDDCNDSHIGHWTK